MGGDFGIGPIIRCHLSANKKSYARLHASAVSRPNGLPRKLHRGVFVSSPVKNNARDYLESSRPLTDGTRVRYDRVPAAPPFSGHALVALLCGPIRSPSVRSQWLP